MTTLQPGANPCQKLERTVSRPVTLDVFLRSLERLSEEEFVAQFPTPLLVADEPEAEDGSESGFFTEKVKLVEIKRHLTGEARQVIPMPADGRWLCVGRSRINELTFRKRRISKFHCHLKRDPRTGSFVVVDPGSRNGSTVNGVRLQTDVPRTLTGGEAIWLAGDARIEFYTASQFYRRYIKSRRKIA